MSVPGRTRAPLATRLFDLLLLAATIATAVSTFYGAGDGTQVNQAAFYLLTSVTWIVLGLVYTVIRVRRIRLARRGDPRWPGWLPGRRKAWLMTAGTAVIVLSSGLNLIVVKDQEDTTSSAVQVLSVTMVLVAWTILQLTYAERYAALYLVDTGTEPPLDFPGTPHPTLLEFAYFSFTIGVTSGTSDTSIRSARWRGVVLCHGLLIFVYNTAVIAMVLSLL